MSQTAAPQAAPPPPAPLPVAVPPNIVLPAIADTTTATLQQVIASEVVSPTRLNPRVPRDLETICLKCLEKEPSRRYAGAAVVIKVTPGGYAAAKADRTRAEDKSVHSKARGPHVRTRLTLLSPAIALATAIFPSLSAAATAIAGSRWNGPRFFGLRDAA